MAASTAGFNYAIGRGHLLLKPKSTEQSAYSWFRLPQVQSDPVGPGTLCWGTVGAMPSPTLIPTVSVKVLTREENRRATQVRIENPNDPEQFINVERADQITFNRSEAKPAAGTNTSAQPAGGIAGYDPARQKSFQPAGGSTTETSKEVVQYKYGPPTGEGYGPPGGPGYGPPSGPGYGPPG